LGDRRWRELLTVHDELARRLIDPAGGRLVNTTGDGIMATFDGPGRGIHCAIALGASFAASTFGFAPGCTSARSSDATTTLAGWPCTSLDDHGTRPLKGVEGDWQLLAVHRPGNPSNR
jgi:class 3 adenylate cyclase